MTEYYFSFPGGLTACFKTACDLKTDNNAMLLLGAYLPGIKQLSERPDRIDLTLEHKIAASPSLGVQGSHITITTKPSKILPADIYHLFYGMLRKVYMKRSLYPVHAVCVGKDGDYTLIVGHSGAGKTSLAQKIIDENGMKLFSGNKTVVRFDGDGLKAIAGTKTMTALDEEQKRCAYELQPHQYVHDDEVKIKNIILVRVNDGVEEYEVLSAPSALHTLYPFLMDSVNADVIVGENFIFDGSISKRVKENIIKKMKTHLVKTSAHKISGNMLFLKNKIMEMHND